jgi:hypothetical protein
MCTHFLHCVHPLTLFPITSPLPLYHSVLMPQHQWGPQSSSFQILPYHLCPVEKTSAYECKKQDRPQSATRKPNNFKYKVSKVSKWRFCLIVG